MTCNQGAIGGGYIVIEEELNLMPGRLSSSTCMMICQVTMQYIIN